MPPTENNAKRPPRPWSVLRLQATLGNRAVLNQLFPRPSPPLPQVPLNPRPVSRPWLLPAIVGGLVGLAAGLLLLLAPRLTVYGTPALGCLAGLFAGLAFSLAAGKRP